MSIVEYIKGYSLLIFLLSIFDVNAQTYFYKRIKIVDRGKTTMVNDDAHYITFTTNRCYDSDKDGISQTSLSLKYIKKENGILCYYGNCIYGSDSYYYVSESKDRINVKNDNKIYVYARVSPHSNTAKLREDTRNHAGYIQPIEQYPIYPAKTSQHKYRKKRRVCPGCNGTGRGMEQIIYAPQYTSDNQVYCEICKAIRPQHSHYQPVCKTCYGKGYVEY